MSSCSLFVLFFSLPNIFTLVAASISPFLTAAMTFSCVSSSLYTDFAFFKILFDNRLDEGEREARERKMNIFSFPSPPLPPYASGHLIPRCFYRYHARLVDL